MSFYTSGGGGIAGGLATIVDMNSLEVDVDVNESYISRVKPGMPVEAFIRTEERTMLSYLLKPLTDQARRAFRER